MPKIDLSRQAARFLADLPKKQARQIAEKVMALEQEPEPAGSLVLKGYAPLRRLKAGEFRIVYRLDGEVVQVLVIGRRNDDDVYRMLARLGAKP